MEGDFTITVSNYPVLVTHYFRANCDGVMSAGIPVATTSPVMMEQPMTYAAPMQQTYAAPMQQTYAAPMMFQTYAAPVQQTYTAPMQSMQVVQQPVQVMQQPVVQRYN